MINSKHILKFWIVNFLLLAFGFANAQMEIVSKESSFSNIYTFEFSTGYNTFQLDDVKDLYEDIVQLYLDENIPIPTQRIYPGNLLLNLSLLKKLSPITSTGISIRYTWTRAFSLYADRFGEINISSKIDFINIGVVLQSNSAINSNLNTIVGIRGGLTFANYSHKQEMIIYDVSNMISTSEIIANGSSPSLEGYIGLEYHLKNFVFTGKFGYRIINISELNGKTKLDNNVQYSGEIPLEVNLSGLILLIGFGYNFN